MTKITGRAAISAGGDGIRNGEASGFSVILDSSPILSSASVLIPVSPQKSKQAGRPLYLTVLEPDGTAPDHKEEDNLSQQKKLTLLSVDHPPPPAGRGKWYKQRGV